MVLKCQGAFLFNLAQIWSTSCFHNSGLHSASDESYFCPFLNLFFEKLKKVGAIENPA